MRPTSQQARRAAAGAALCIVAACAGPPGPASEGGSFTIGSGAGATRDTAAFTSNLAGGSVEVSWRQVVTGPGFDVYLYASDAADACHVSAGATRLHFHCRDHGDMIELGGLDTSAPHEVTIRFGKDGTVFRLTRQGSVVPGGTGAVSDAPDLAAGERLRVQFAARESATARIEDVAIRQAD